MKKNRRRGSRPIDRLARALRAAIAGLVVPALLLGAALGVARWAAHHPYFRLRTVAVEGARDPEAVVAWAKVRHDVSLWSIDPESTEIRLLSHPRIRSASVRREFPDRLRVKVEERLPLAVLLLDDPLFVDAEGRVFPPFARELLGDYPYVSGLRAADLEERPAW
ncbi:MAG: cell division protein FtsQ/DivIB, partial [Candidatus Binatia bacterium]